MFYYIYKHALFQRIIVALLLLGVCLSFAFYPEMLPSQTHTPLYTWLYGWLSNSPVKLVLVFLFILAGQLWLLDIYAKNSAFKETHTQMPLFWFLLFLLITNVIAPLSPIFFINFIALLILNISSREKQKNIKRSLYLSGLLVGIASLIEIYAIVLLIFVLVRALIKDAAKSKELIIAFLGLFTVYLYLFSGYFLMDNLSGFVQLFDPQNWIYPYLQVLNYTPAQFVFLAVIILLFSYILIFFAVKFRNKIIQIRERTALFHVFTITMFFVSGMNIDYLMGTLIISFSVYYAMLNAHRNGWIVRDIVLLLSVLFFLFTKVWN